MPNCGFNISWERLGFLEEVLEFEIVFKQKPLMNVLSFRIKAEGLRFSYQPFLTEQDKSEGVERPPNVEGSYAVYHVTKKNNQYMTGKAFHIYRPIAEDAVGNKAWCAIHIDGYIDPKNLTITVPQQFLNEATYPVTIDPDFGDNSIGGSWWVIANTALWESARVGSATAMPAPGGTANWIKAYVYGSGNPTDCKVAIYEKDSGGAGTHGRIAGPVENLACAIAAHWEEFTLASEALTEAVVYILAIVGNMADPGGKDNYLVAYDDNGAVASYSSTTAYTMPDPWVVDPDGTTKDYSIYCDYSEPAAGLENKSANMGSKMVAAGLI